MCELLRAGTDDDSSRTRGEVIFLLIVVLTRGAESAATSVCTMNVLAKSNVFVDCMHSHLHTNHHNLSLSVFVAVLRIDNDEFEGNPRQTTT